MSIRLQLIFIFFLITSCTRAVSVATDSSHFDSITHDSQLHDYGNNQEQTDYESSISDTTNDTISDQFSDSVDAQTIDAQRDQNVPIPAPLAYWSMDNASISGSTLNPIAGSVTGTITNATTSTDAVVGESLNFQQASNAYIDFGDVFNANFAGSSNDFSVSMWIKTTSSAVDRVLLAKTADTACTPNYEERQFSTSLTTTNTSRFYGANNSAANYITLNGSLSINDSQWSHLVFVHHGTVSTSEDARVDLYVNGNQASKTLVSSNGSFPFDLEPSTARLSFGVRLSPTGGTCVGSGSQFYTGRLDELAIWDRGLTQAEVDSLYAKGLAGQPLY